MKVMVVKTLKELLEHDSRLEAIRSELEANIGDEQLEYALILESRGSLQKPPSANGILPSVAILTARELILVETKPNKEDARGYIPIINRMLIADIVGTTQEAGRFKVLLGGGGNVVFDVDQPSALLPFIGTLSGLIRNVSS
ncbi:hypothetical protein A3K24_03185 [candidate division Kazan bacterium RIFCSPHIGHO2_01_FULL_44_14]|uniref:Uncharacterized protein n=1 Tax=candidate division Kazan bacterium RIFCSPLOWO2_01_FULL_45_19 TaxID=1798538 RepID=A0A1F4NQV6_UNCK3|nr:hypothetical protein [uncultured bacterium]OGB73801.1 MAG: hypothetical protein A3K51_03185 [candidate division Kazan bacterium RIFCSPLOWO2_01_FULL_45_19]OGB78046.1 MAG: hypothetical protein A3K24_03185 [candidate division Kazan bacterium RIFCSPHIGHO2_01_FULL_44_14]